MHLAAQSGVRPSVQSPSFDASVNIMGTLNVLECCTRTGVRKVVYAASGGTLYGEPRKLPVKETAAGAGHPLSPYGISKKIVVDYLGFYERYRGVDFTALALANVYGPRQDPTGEAGVIAIFSSMMIAGRRRRSSATATRPATTCSSTTSCTPSRSPPTTARGGSRTSVPGSRPR